jgi:hypothetical protein
MAEDRTRQTTAMLHTAGPNILDRIIRLDLPLGPAAFGSGLSRSKESNAELSGVERVDGGGYGEPNRDGPGSTKMYCHGKVALLISHPPYYRWDTAVLAPLRDGPFIREALRVSGVRFDGSPNSNYNVYICYTNVSLCQREHRKHMS